MKISFSSKGDFANLTKFLTANKDGVKLSQLDKFCREGVNALSSATPVNTGLTASSWDYKITKKHGEIEIQFLNKNIQNGVPIAIILQYGHGTRNGGWVEGRDYINPAIQPIFKKIEDAAWKEVNG